ncbi:MAG: hypothetical protein ABI743_03130 [bacterium]
MTRTDTVTLPVDNLAEFKAVIELGSLTLKTIPGATELTCAATVTLKVPSDALGKEYLDQVSFTLAGDPDSHRADFKIKFPAQWHSANWANRPGSLKLDLVVTGPPGLSYDLATTTGPLTVEGTVGDLSARTNTGDIDFGQGVDGRCSVTASTGDIIGTLRNTTDATINSTTGDVTLRFDGPGTGLKHLSVSLSTGDVDVTLPEIKSADFSITAGTGDMHIALPKTSAAAISLVTKTGTCTVTGGTITTSGTQQPNEVSGRLNNPEGSIKVNIVTGSVTLHLT